VNFAAYGASQLPDILTSEGKNPLARQSSTQDARINDGQSTQSDAEWTFAKRFSKQNNQTNTVTCIGIDQLTFIACFFSNNRNAAMKFILYFLRPYYLKYFKQKFYIGGLTVTRNTNALRKFSFYGRVHSAVSGNSTPLKLSMGK